MPIPDQPPRYFAYLLRIWEERTGDGKERLGWRFHLEDTHTGRYHGFADLSALLAYLQNIAGDEGPGAATGK